MEITEKRRKSFENYLNNYSEINYKSIFCDSAEMVKEKLEIILEYEKFDGIFAKMSDETFSRTKLCAENKRIKCETL